VMPSTAASDLVTKSWNVDSTGNLTPVFQPLANHIIGCAIGNHISYKHFVNNALRLTAVID
jgi:hypothetical protein